MNLLFEGRIGCFQPVTNLDRPGVTQIRPLLYCQEADIRRMASKLALPVVKNTCPMDGHSRRQEVKELLAELEQRYPDLKRSCSARCSATHCTAGTCRSSSAELNKYPFHQQQSPSPGTPSTPMVRALNRFSPKARPLPPAVAFSSHSAPKPSALFSATRSTIFSGLAQQRGAGHR